MNQRVQQTDLWRRTGNAVAWVASFYLRYKACELLAYPWVIAAAWKPVSTLALAIPGVIMLGLFVAALAYRKFPKAPSPFFGIALFSFAALIALPRADIADTAPRWGFAILLAYSLIHGLLNLKVKRRPALPPALKAPTPGSWFVALNGRGLTVTLGVLFTVALVLHAYWNGSYLYAKARVLLSPTFDHGIFVHAMEGILRTGQPVTTLERAQELSHFAVHFSPVLYLMAPFYAIFRTPWGLNVLQLLPVLLALLPLWGALKEQHLTRNLILFFLTLYVLSPAQIFSSHYDFHENIFLGLGIFTLWYFWEKRSFIGTLFGTLLVLGVKEDAFVYVFAFMLWQLFESFARRDQKRVITSAGFLVFSLLYFVVVTRLMARYGMGTMESSRFANLLPPGAAGFTELIKVMFDKPAFVLTQIFQEDKLRYLLLVLGVTGFAPLWTRDYALNFLLIPLVLVNVLSDWPYQYDIGFQYHYGTSALLFIILAATVVDLRRRKYRPRLQTALVCLILVFSLVFSMAYSLPKLHEKKVRADGYLDNDLQQADEILDYVSKLPKDQTYLTSTMLGAAFYQHPAVYEMDNLPFGEFDFSKIDCIVMDARYALSTEESAKLDFLIRTYGFEADTAYAPVLVFTKK